MRRRATSVETVHVSRARVLGRRRPQHGKHPWNFRMIRGPRAARFTIVLHVARSMTASPPERDVNGPSAVHRTDDLARGRITHPTDGRAAVSVCDKRCSGSFRDLNSPPRAFHLSSPSSTRLILLASNPRSAPCGAGSTVSRAPVHLRRTPHTAPFSLSNLTNTSGRHLANETGERAEVE